MWLYKATTITRRKSNKGQESANQEIEIIGGGFVIISHTHTAHPFNMGTIQGIATPFWDGIWTLVIGNFTMNTNNE